MTRNFDRLMLLHDNAVKAHMATTGAQRFTRAAVHKITFKEAKNAERAFKRFARKVCK